MLSFLATLKMKCTPKIIVDDDSYRAEHVTFTFEPKFESVFPDHLTGGHAMTKYLQTVIRVSSLEDSIAFFEGLGPRSFHSSQR
jgi:hypothetical protein